MEEMGRKSEKFNEKRGLGWKNDGKFGKIDRKELKCRQNQHRMDEGVS